VSTPVRTLIKEKSKRQRWVLLSPASSMYLSNGQSKKHPTLLDQARTGLVAMVPSYRRPHHQVGLRS